MIWSSSVRGDTRNVKRFLFLPKKLNGLPIWLEFVYIHQMYDPFYGWRNMFFVDESKIEDFYD